MYISGSQCMTAQESNSYGEAALYCGLPLDVMAHEGEPCLDGTPEPPCLVRGWEMLIYCSLLASPTSSTVTQSFDSRCESNCQNTITAKKCNVVQLTQGWRAASPQESRPSFLSVKTTAKLQLTSKALRLGGNK